MQDCVELSKDFATDSVELSRLLKAPRPRDAKMILTILWRISSRARDLINTVAEIRKKNSDLDDEQHQFAEKQTINLILSHMQTTGAWPSLTRNRRNLIAFFCRKMAEEPDVFFAPRAIADEEPSFTQLGKIEHELELLQKHLRGSGFVLDATILNPNAKKITVACRMCKEEGGLAKRERLTNI